MSFLSGISNFATGIAKSPLGILNPTTIGLGALSAGLATKQLGGGSGANPFPNADTSGVQGSPEIAAMRSRLDQIQPEKFNYQKKDYSGPLQEYQDQRTQLANRVGEQFNQQGQQNEDAISRRFAAMGNLNSGAAVKASQLAQESNARERNQALTGGLTQIGNQEAQARRGLQETENQREFQTGMANTTNANQFNQFKVAQGNQISQLDLAHRNMEVQRRQDAYQNDLNQYKAAHSGGLFGGGGFLGTGL